MKSINKLWSPVVLVNECLANPCPSGSSCLDQLKGHQCICKAGYEHDTVLNLCKG